MTQCGEGIIRDVQLTDRAGRCLASHTMGGCYLSCGGLSKGMTPCLPHRNEDLSRPAARKAPATSRQKAVRALAWALVLQLLYRVDAQAVGQGLYAQRQQASIGSSPVAAGGSQQTQPAYLFPQPAYSSAPGSPNGLSPQLWWPASDTKATAVPAFMPAPSRAASTSVEDTVFVPGMQPIDTSGNWVCSQAACLLQQLRPYGAVAFGHAPGS